MTRAEWKRTIQLNSCCATVLVMAERERTVQLGSCCATEMVTNELP